MSKKDARRFAGLSLALALVGVAVLLGLPGGLPQAASAQETGSQSEAAARAAVGTAFTYQGRLTDGGSPANGTYDLQFQLYDAANDGDLLGTVTREDLTVSDGPFTVRLDFGQAFDGTARYLAIGVRPGSSTGAYTPLSPRQELTPAPHALALPGLWTQQNGTSPNLIGGYSGNIVAAGVVGATIGGGGNSSYRNVVSGGYGTVSGGAKNTASSSYATVGGGNGNMASGDYATVSGGWFNSANGSDATVGGGEGNTASGPCATVSGGSSNTANVDYATVGGGEGNTAGLDYATVGGGSSNTASGGVATVGGGGGNTANSGYTTVGGGASNTASALYATVSGGWLNSASGSNTTVGGGKSNTASGWYATVGGGNNNTADGEGATVGGGIGNASASWATVGGGSGNTASIDYATVGGGNGNTVIEGEGATISGGGDNTISGGYATIGGGWRNTASGMQATIPGGQGNTAQGDYSFAAGHRAKANHTGSFVLADSTDEDFASVRDDALRARFSGGATFVLNDGYWVRLWKDGTHLIDTNAGGSPPSGAHLTTGGTWTNGSDRNSKENFRPVDGQEVLARLAGMPIQTWNYRAEGPAIRRMGPTSQDFYAAFGLGEDDLHIATVDADGVALAAIQGLYQRSQEQVALIEALEAENAALQQALEDLAARLAALEVSMAKEARP